MTATSNALVEGCVPYKVNDTVKAVVIVDSPWRVKDYLKCRGETLDGGCYQVTAVD